MLKKQISEILNNNQGEFAVAIKNLNNNDMLLINEDKVFPSASTIKLLIMTELLSQADKGQIDINKNITITEEMLTGGDGIIKELNYGHHFTIQEIMTLMIILSDNMATNILIDLLGIDNINKQSKDLNLKNTILQRKMMDLNAAKEGKDNYTCASDLLILLDLMYQNKLINENFSKLMINTLKKQQVKGRLDLYLSEDITIAHKTGDLDFLEHDVGIVYLDNIDYIICVLTNKNTSNKNGREIIGQISKITYDYFSKINNN